jgi:hypothetical protein
MASGPDRHRARDLAKAWGLSASWVRTLGRRARRQSEIRRPGRPRLAERERARVRALVAVQLDVQGLVGWRDVLGGILRLGERVSTMLVQQETATGKRERRAATRRAIEAARAGHEVLARDAVWCQDTTHVGRLEGGEEVAAELITDRATLSVVSLTVGAVPDSGDVCADLERAAQERGGWPLVRQRDRAGIYGTPEALAQLKRERVVDLLSRAHTPTDNPVAEHMNGELLAESELGVGVRLGSTEEAAARLAPARARLSRRLRATRGYRSADELDRGLRRADEMVDRDRFYAAACTAKQEAVLGLTERTAIERAEQRAVWLTLVRFGLARPRRGRCVVPCPRVTPVAAGSSG